MHNMVEIAREFANAIKSDYIIKIILFGSVARGDVLIVSNNPIEIDDIIADEVAWIMYDKNELISAHVMSEELFNRTKSFSFLTNVLKEGVLIG